MSKSHYPYPPDEFDVRGPEGTPVGVHREPRSGWGSVWPFLLIAVVCGGVAVGAVSFLSDDGPSTPPAAEQSAGAGGGEPEAEGADPEASGEAEAPAEEPTDGASEEPGEEPSEPAGELPGDPTAANLEAPVVVYNDGAGAGQAAAGQGVLGETGFSDVTPDDAVNAPAELAGAYEATTVLYGADRADTASAVAESLGVDPANVQESDDVTASEQAVWVVLKTPVG